MFHCTIEQCHSLEHFITDVMECCSYCSAVFLDVRQALKLIILVKRKTVHA